MSWPANLFTVLEHNKDDTDLTTYTTGSFTIPAGVLVLLCYALRGSGGSPNVPTINKHTGGASAGFTSVVSVNNAGTNERTGIMRLVAGSAITDSLDIVSSVAAQGCIWSVILVGGTDLGGSNGANSIAQTSTGTLSAQTSATANLGTLINAGDVYIFAVKHDNANAGSAGASTTVLSDDSGTAPAHTLTVAYSNPGDTTHPVVNWTTSANGAHADAELKIVPTQLLLVEATS